MQIGQHVLCISDRPTRDVWRGVQVPQKGVVYTIRDLRPSPVTEGKIVLLLAEIRNPTLFYTLNGRPLGEFERGFGAYRFRPLTKLTIEDFTTSDVPIDLVPA